MIDRFSVVERHSPHYNCINRNAPLSVGNGSFCFTADFTGLQTFFDEYTESENAFPLCTMAEWGWHSYPHDPGEETALRLTPYDTYGRIVYYASDNTGQEELFRKVRLNAHKFHLGKIGFEYFGKTLSFDNCKPVSQHLSLWKGILFSDFLIDGEKITTETFVHPEADTLYVRVLSSLSQRDKLSITIHFPYASHKKNAADFSRPESHITRHKEKIIERKLDDTFYNVSIDGHGIEVSVNESQHLVTVYPQSKKIEFGISFFQAENGINETAHKYAFSYETAREKCMSFWEQYWTSGGVIDFSGSTDLRATELERRIILSQYLIAIQSRGQLPPAETGLSCNSWYGKFHLEMYFWHHAHFALWGRTQELKKTLAYYKQILPVAREIAASQGYQGARWPKMCDPSGKNTPSSVAVLLIWQQPHPIMLAELCYRAVPDEAFLREYYDVVIETADFMVSFVHWEEHHNRYVLGPPYILAQERHDPAVVLNSGYELEYFRWGLHKADEWLGRLGEPSRYGKVADKLSFPSHKDGVYLAHENCPHTFSAHPFFTDHPSMLAMYGVLNSKKVDTHIMSATLDKVRAVWDKNSLYGWDFPMMAMTACRLGRYRDAIDILCMESAKNTYMENGHNRMKGDDALPLYLPGNGGLLLAVAMMAAGYDGNKGSLFPEGFTITTEGICQYI